MVCGGASRAALVSVVLIAIENLEWQIFFEVDGRRLAISLSRSFEGLLQGFW
jgi:hypothetical protein